MYGIHILGAWPYFCIKCDVLKVFDVETVRRFNFLYSNCFKYFKVVLNRWNGIKQLIVKFSPSFVVSKPFWRISKPFLLTDHTYFHEQKHTTQKINWHLNYKKNHVHPFMFTLGQHENYWIWCQKPRTFERLFSLQNLINFVLILKKKVKPCTKNKDECSKRISKNLETPIKEYFTPIKITRQKRSFRFYFRKKKYNHWRPTCHSHFRLSKYVWFLYIPKYLYQIIFSGITDKTKLKVKSLNKQLIKTMNLWAANVNCTQDFRNRLADR